jgi:hypothetical protein
MITRAQYMADTSLHHAYYLEVATTAKVRISADLLERCRTSQDPAYNDIRLPDWYMASTLYRRAISMALRERGDFLSDAAQVCVMKACAAEQVKKAQTQTEIEHSSDNLMPTV